eukprot:scaffold3.g6164.t1
MTSSIRVYERATAPAGGLQRFADINQAGEVLRPGSVVCLVKGVAEDMLVAAKDGSSWHLAVRRTGWSSREYNGLSTYSQDYLVESLPAEMLWLVVRNGGSVGFCSLAAGRMLQAADGPAALPVLSTRTPSNWGAAEAWERQRADGSVELVSARGKHPLGFAPLLVSCLPTASLVRAEAFWGAQLFSLKEQAREAAAVAREREARTAAQLKMTQRQLAIANSRVEELEGRLQLEQEGELGGVLAELKRSYPSPRGEGAEAGAWCEGALAQQARQESQMLALQQHHSLEVEELQDKLAAAEQALLDLAAEREAVVAAAKAELQAKDAECHRLLQDRHRLDAALFTIKNMALAIKQCSPSSSGGTMEPQAPEAPAAGDAGTDAAGPVLAQQLSVGQASIDNTIPDVAAAAATQAQAHEPQPRGAEQLDAWLNELPLPDNPLARRLTEEEMVISFQQQQAVHPAPAPSESDADSQQPAEVPGTGCRVVNYGGSNPARLDEAGLSRILDQPAVARRPRAARIYQALASCPASPATGLEASPDRADQGAWPAGSLSLPSSCIKVLEPSNGGRRPLRDDMLRASAAVLDMGATSSPKAADALAELFADQVVMRASLRQLPPQPRGRGGQQLRHSAPAAPVAKPRSSFLQRSALPDVFNV